MTRRKAARWPAAMTKAYYNEIDPFKAETLREAIKAGAIALGDVDERSICDVRPGDLRGYAQHHFFAGGGFWSLALRLAGWPDERPVATLSCPCPSFSAAGKGKGFDDPRHLWPHAFRLIRECRFPVCFGEQVAAAIGHGWLDLVSGDLEAEGYAVAAAVLGAHSVGAPHIRQRLYFCAHTNGSTRFGGEPQAEQWTWPARPDGEGSQRAHTAERGERAQHGESRQGIRQESEVGGRGVSGERSDARHEDGPARISGGEYQSGASVSEQSGGASQTLCGDNPLSAGLEGHFGDVREWRGPGWLDPLTARSVAKAGATRGFWADCDWWYGRDEKYRPAGSGIQPLASRHSPDVVLVCGEGGEEVSYGATEARVGRLRLYGDAIVVPVVAEFIRVGMEALDATDSS